MPFTTTAAYLARPTSHYDPKVDIPLLDGKVAIVTGGSSGMGYYIVQQLAQAGARVFLCSRTEEKGRAAIERMKNEGGFGSGSVHFLQLELSTPKLAKDAAVHYMTNEHRLDILINNAGTSGEDYETVDINNANLEISRSMAVCHLGHFVFTETLMPLLKHTASRPGTDVRIITVSSEAHRGIVIAPKFGTVDGWNSSGNMFLQRAHRASLAKLANVLFAKELQRKLKSDTDGRNILSISVHPGEFGRLTRGLVQSLPYPMNLLGLSQIKLFITLFGGLTPYIMTPKEAAYSTLYAATSPVVRCHPKVYEGAYICPYTLLVEPSSLASSEELARELWEFTEQLISMCALA